MKKKICLAMSGLLAMGTVQAYGRDWAVRTEPHVYTAEVGTTRFWKDGEAQPLDVEEIKGKPIITGEGKAAVFALPLTEKYDEIENIGGGYFLAETYMEKSVGLGQGIGSLDDSYFLLDSTGKELLHFASGTIRNLENLGEGYFLVWNKDRKQENTVIDRNGKTIFTTPYSMDTFSEGLAVVENRDQCGFLDTSGKLVISMEYCEAEPFSEGLAAVTLEDSQVYLHGQYDREKWGYIDKTGRLVIDAKYQTAQPFSEGMAAVRTEDGVGYIDKSGKEVIPCQYRWGGYFRNGVTYVTEEDSQETWLIVQTGKKLKLIATGEYLSYRDDSFRKDGKPKNGVLQKEEIAEYGDTHSHVISLYDETGKISFETYELKKGLSEGLSPWREKETGKYGYVDTNGKRVIAPAFDEAELFNDGYAIVANEITKPDGEIDVEWGIIQHP